MSFINNLKRAKNTVKTAAASRPAFAKFLDAMARDHKGKLSLDNLLIKPVQKFPSYKLLVERLIKNTGVLLAEYYLFPRLFIYFMAWRHFLVQ